MERSSRVLLLAAGALALAYGGVALTGHAHHIDTGPSRLPRPGVVRMGTPTAPEVPSKGSGDLGELLPDPEVLSSQKAQYEARRPKTPLELQQFRRTSSMPIRTPAGRDGVALLVDLNPRINDWYLLGLRWNDGEESWLHLENARPDRQRLVLDPAFPAGLVVVGAGGARGCEMWSHSSPSLVGNATDAVSPYVELCGGDVLIRHRTQGSRTAREWAADFLRKNVNGGEALTVLVRRTVYADAFLEQAELASGTKAREPVDESGLPPPALVAQARKNDLLVPRDLGIAVPGRGAMLVGRWYPVADTPGVFVSMITPGRISPDVLGSREKALDAIERNALVYLIAFDLGRFELGWGLGTDHPDVGWSERASEPVREKWLPGPDGLGSLAPLQPTGLVPPQVRDRVVATFAGGFKRAHGAFLHGELSRVNEGSHYGFIEEGTVLSKLQPDLATLFTLDDGQVEMKTWSRADDALLERVRFARQNGVPLLERDPLGGAVIEGALVGRWGEGNWGGSQESKLRAVRAGAALLESGGQRFLVYGYFSSVTPSAMALVLAAYGCDYAMHLDMNALEHTYLALYRAREDSLDVEHLVRGMSVLDKTSGSTTIPRFLGYADNRDFFYVMKKREAAASGSLVAGSSTP